MTNFRRDKKDHKYHIRGRSYRVLNGTRAQVYHGTAYKTRSGLTKEDLVRNKRNRIVSRKKHISSKRENRLVKHGFVTKKGKFGSYHVGGTRGGRHRGGYASNSFSPASIDEGSVGKLDTSLSANGIAGAGITDFDNQGSIGVQLRSGQTAGRRRRRHGGTMKRMGGRRRRRPRRGGYASNSFDPMPLSGSGIDGAGITDYSSPQERAGMANGGRKRRRRGGTPYGSALSPMSLTGGRRRRHSRRRRGGMAPNISNALDISGEGYQSDPNSISTQLSAGLAST